MKNVRGALRPYPFAPVFYLFLLLFLELALTEYYLFEVSIISGSSAAGDSENSRATLTPGRAL
jgi:hypothetical protein